MKIKYTAIAEMREAQQQFTEQLESTRNWLDKLSQRVYACQTALNNDIISLEDMPEKIGDLRSDLYEIDKVMEIIGVNCASLTATQTKEDDEQTGNRTSTKQTNGTPEK